MSGVEVLVGEWEGVAMHLNKTKKPEISYLELSLPFRMNSIGTFAKPFLPASCCDKLCTFLRTLNMSGLSGTVGRRRQKRLIKEQDC